jgi:nicotinate-nucleotide adenylyltransferase
MTELAIEGVDGFEVDPLELKREGPTYTVDTLTGFPPDEELVLILGADAALGIPTWHRFHEVLQRARVLVAPRPGTDSTAVAVALPDASFLDMAVLEVSGTEIREMAAAGGPFRFLVTEPVHRYIEENRLYAQPGKDDMVRDSPETEESS